LTSNRRGLIPFVSLCVASAVVVELGLELCGIDPEGGALSGRHGLLAVLAFAAVAVFGAYLLAIARSATSMRDFKRLLRIDLTALPTATRDQRRLGLTVTSTFVVGLLAQLGQHGFNRPGDVLGWLIAAMLSALLMTLIVRAVVRSLSDVVARIVAFFVRQLAAPLPIHQSRTVLIAGAPVEAWPAVLFNRPPPIFQH
jgi:hypothetical protein